MDERSRAENAALDRYEKLILLKNELKKECFQLEQEHTREFGKEVRHEEDGGGTPANPLLDC